MSWKSVAIEYTKDFKTTGLSPRNTDIGTLQFIWPFSFHIQEIIFGDKQSAEVAARNKTEMLKTLVLTWN